MTKKDHIAIAACIKAEWEDRLANMNKRQRQPDSAHGAIYSIMSRIAVELAMDNPHFDRDKFIKACGF